MSLLAFVQSGSTQTAFIQGVARVHEPVRIRFRQVPQIDHLLVESEIADLYRKDQRKAADRRIAEVIAERLVSWEFLDRQGKVIEGAPKPTTETVLMTKGPLQDRLVLIVYKQRDGGDLDPFDESTETRSGQQVVADDSKN